MIDEQPTNIFLDFFLEIGQLLGVLIALIAAGIAYGKGRKQVEQLESKMKDVPSAEEHKALKKAVEEAQAELRKLHEENRQYGLAIATLTKSVEHLVTSSERVEQKIDRLIERRSKGD